MCVEYGGSMKTKSASPSWGGPRVGGVHVVAEGPQVVAEGAA